MLRRQIIVDAYDEDGVQGKADLFDLDDDSLKFVLAHIEKGQELVAADAKPVILKLLPGLKFR